MNLEAFVKKSIKSVDSYLAEVPFNRILESLYNNNSEPTTEGSLLAEIPNRKIHLVFNYNSLQVPDSLLKEVEAVKDTLEEIATVKDNSAIIYNSSDSYSYVWPKLEEEFQESIFNRELQMSLFPIAYDSEITVGNNSRVILSDMSLVDVNFDIGDNCLIDVKGIPRSMFKKIKAKNNCYINFFSYLQSPDNLSRFITRLQSTGCLCIEGDSYFVQSKETVQNTYGRGRQFGTNAAELGEFSVYSNKGDTVLTYLNPIGEKAAEFIIYEGTRLRNMPSYYNSIYCRAFTSFINKAKNTYDFYRKEYGI